MSEDNVYNDADIVWVKLGNSWWPGEVCGQQRQPEGFLQSVKRKPYCVVKFFQEDTFEYVKSSKHILPFNCSKKEEFIKKGHELFKAKKKFMEKFPSDVSTAERLTRSVTKSTLFFNSRPDSIVKAILGQSPAKINLMRSEGRCDSVTKIINITPNRNAATKSLTSSPATYKCSLCEFQSTRQNVMVLHRKSHSNTPAVTKNSLTNTSTNISPSAIVTLNQFASQTLSISTLPSSVGFTVHKNPVSGKAASFQLDDSDIVNDKKSDSSSEEDVDQKRKSTNSLATARSNSISQNENPTIIRPEPSRHENHTCKSVEIQKSLLADWMDEDKDDEDEEKSSNERKSHATNDLLGERNEKEVNPGLTISAPTSPELLKGVDLNYLGETSSSSESSKPSIKIRNIPKKDRRNFSFTIFKKGQNIDIPSETIIEAELSTKTQSSLNDLVNNSSKEGVSKELNMLSITNATEDNIRLLEEKRFMKNLPTSSITIESVIKDKSIQTNSTVVSQQGTCGTEYIHNEILNATVSGENSSNVTTSTLAIEYIAETLPGSETKSDSLRSESSFSELTNSLSISSSIRMEVSDNLKIVHNTTEISAQKDPMVFENSSQDLNIISPTREQIDFTVPNKTMLKKDHIVNQLYSEFPYNSSVKDNLAEFKETLEENLQIQSSQEKVSEMKFTAAKIIRIEEDISTGMNTLLERVPEATQNENSYMQQKLSGGDPTTNQYPDISFNGVEQPTTIIVPDPHSFPVSEAAFTTTECKISSKEDKKMKENEKYLQQNDDKTTIPGIPHFFVKKNEVYNDCVCMLPENNESPTAPGSEFKFSLKQIVLSSTDSQESQAAENIAQGTHGIINENLIVNKVNESEFSVRMEVENTSQVKEVIEIPEFHVSKSNNKTSLSCFDFEEEEDNDILTSIAKFKKKNISSERTIDINKESCCKILDAQNVERELKDKQLSTDIESLLKTTENLVPTASASAEVRGLPIKERGKRIFKSRNRFKAESSSSIKTTSSAEKNILSVTLFKKEEEAVSSATKPLLLKQDNVRADLESDKVTDPAQVEESSIDKMSFEYDNTISEKVTNSEEEIVGRVVFSPAELYAPPIERNAIDCSENTDTQVSSSVMEIGEVSLPNSTKQNCSEELFSNENCLTNLESNYCEKIVANEIEGHQLGNRRYFEVVEENPTEAIVQLGPPHAAVQNQMMHLNTESTQQDIHATDENQILLEERRNSAQVVHKEAAQTEIVHEHVNDVQQVHDQLNEFFVVEGSEPIYEEEVSYEDVSNKTIDTNYENSNDYELITTEVSSIVERIGSEDNSIECNNSTVENIPIAPHELGHGPVVDNDEPTTVELSKNLSKECNIALFSTTKNVIDAQCNYVSKELETPEMELLTPSDNPILSEESNTCSTVENISKNSEGDKSIHLEDKPISSRAERTEASSDDNSTIISEAEAEFGSPTSMLEEDRVLKRSRRGSETSTTNIECPKGLHTTRVQNTETNTNGNRFCKKDNALSQQLLQSDRTESTSSDVQSSLSNISNDVKESVKEDVDNIILKVIQKELLKMKEGEINKFVEVSSKNEQNLSEYNSGADSGDEEDGEDEEEISSPPIEPLQDEHTVETYPNMSINTLDSIEFLDREKETCSMQGDDQQNSIDNSVRQAKTPNPVHSSTQNTGTVIKLNFNKDTLIVKKTDRNSTQGIEEKSDIAGEELSAAEALLSIPNQSGSNLVDATDLSTRSVVSIQSPINSSDSSAVAANEVKDELMDNMDIASDLKGNTSKEFIRRKGRSHLKVTPRKRIIGSGYPDINHTEEELSHKIRKLSHDSAHSSSEPPSKTESDESKTMWETVDAVTTYNINTEVSEKSTPEKVHITVDISNPLSSQIANILSSIDSAENTVKNVAQKRKTTLEDDITSFVIKKPGPTTDAEAEAADRETIAQIQNLCPQVKITRKSSKDEQTSLTTNMSQQSTQHIFNNQMLRSGNNQPIITVTPKSKKLEEAFDINNMPIVLSNDNVINEKVHLVITPTSNPEIIKQFQSQQQLALNKRSDSRSFTPSPVNIVPSRISSRRQSNLRTKRTLTRQQIQEQNCQNGQEQISNQSSQDENIQTHALQQHSNQQSQINIHQPQQQQSPQLQQNKRQQQFRTCQQGQMHTQHSPAQFQNQFQLHQQQKLQQKLQEEQSILMQQQQMMIQQQMQLPQNQQRPQLQRQQQQHQQQQILIHQHLLPVEKTKPSNTSDKQIGVDARGKKYVIIKAPSNTVVMDNNPETTKGSLQNIHQPSNQQHCEQRNTAQRKQRQMSNLNKKQLSHQIVQPISMQTIPNLKALNQSSTVTQSAPSPLPHVMPASSHPTYTNANVSYVSETQRYFKEQQTSQLFSPTLSSLSMIPPKSRGSGRGRRAKQIAANAPSQQAIENTTKNAKSSAYGKRTTGNICESPRHRATRSSAAKKLLPIEMQSSFTTELIPTTVYHSRCSVNTVNTVTTISTPIAHSLLNKGRTLSDKQGVPAEIIIEKSKVSGGCYAVPALPVPGFPHTFLVCELIDNKYREAYSKLLYLSPDGTRLCEIPDELVTEAHLKLKDDQREPNPDYIQVGSGALQIDKSIRLQMSEQDKLQADDEMENISKSNEIFKHDSLSVEEQASTLLCLQEQIVQEQLAQEQLVQKQYVPEHLVHEQLVQEHLAQEQLVQEQLVQEQYVQEHFVQDQFGQEQFVQEQFVQEQFVPEQFVQEQIAQEQLVRGQFMQHPHEMKSDQNILHVTHSIGNDEGHNNIIQHLDADTVVMDESVESPNAVVLNIGSQHLVLDHTAFMNMCENNTEGMSPDGNIFTLTQEGLQELLNSCNSSRNETSAMVFTGEGCEQRVMMNENILHTDETSPDCLRIALNDPRLYAEEQYINSGSILQIETPEGLRLISTTPGSSEIVIQSMPSDSKTCEANILDQRDKSSPTHDESYSGNIKRKFENDPSTTTLDDCLNVIGVSGQSPPIPQSLELSQSETITKKRGPSPGTIAMNEIVATGLCHHPDITSIPSMGSSEQDMHYGFFSSNTSSHNDKVNANSESVVTDMDEYTVGSSNGNFDDPGR